MVRVLSLLWTLIFALLITAVSYFYITDNIKHGFPFTFAREVVDGTGQAFLNINYWSVALDVLIWWLLFSICWIIVRNYILQTD